MDRRSFLGFLSKGILAFAFSKIGVSEAKNRSVSPLISDILKNWNFRKASLSKSLTINQFLQFREFVLKLKSARIQTQKEKDLIYIYEKIKYPYLTYLTRKKIEKLLPMFKRCDKRVTSKIRKTVVTDRKIYLNEINKNYTQALKELSKRYRVPVQIPIILSIIENNYGVNKISSANACGPLQIKEETIIDMELRYKLPGKYCKMKNKAERFWRELEAAILYIRYIIELLGLNITETNIPKIDLLILGLCYKEGITKILENFDMNESYDKDAVVYICEIITLMHYELIY